METSGENARERAERDLRMLEIAASSPMPASGVEDFTRIFKCGLDGLGKRLDYMRTVLGSPFEFDIDLENGGRECLRYFEDDESYKRTSQNEDRPRLYYLSVPKQARQNFLSGLIRKSKESFATCVAFFPPSRCHDYWGISVRDSRDFKRNCNSPLDVGLFNSNCRFSAHHHIYCLDLFFQKYSNELFNDSEYRERIAVHGLGRALQILDDRMKNVGEHIREAGAGIKMSLDE